MGGKEGGKRGETYVLLYIESRHTGGKSASAPVGVVLLSWILISLPPYATTLAYAERPTRSQLLGRVRAATRLTQHMETWPCSARSRKSGSSLTLTIYWGIPPGSSAEVVRFPQRARPTFVLRIFRRCENIITESQTWFLAFATVTICSVGSKNSAE